MTVFRTIVYIGYEMRRVWVWDTALYPVSSDQLLRNLTINPRRKEMGSVKIMPSRPIPVFTLRR